MTTPLSAQTPFHYPVYTESVAHSCSLHIAHTVAHSVMHTQCCSSQHIVQAGAHKWMCLSDQPLPCTASLPHSWLTPCLCRDSLLVFIRRARIFPATTLSYLVACLPACLPRACRAWKLISRQAVTCPSQKETPSPWAIRGRVRFCWNKSPPSIIEPNWVVSRTDPAQSRDLAPAHFQGHQNCY